MGVFHQFLSGRKRDMSWCSRPVSQCLIITQMMMNTADSQMYRSEAEPEDICHFHTLS